MRNKYEVEEWFDGPPESIEPGMVFKTERGLHAIGQCSVMGTIDNVNTSGLGEGLLVLSDTIPGAFEFVEILSWGWSKIKRACEEVRDAQTSA